MEKTIEYFKDKLEQELTILETELEEAGRRNPEHPNDWEATPDDMDALAADESEVASKLESLDENSSLVEKLEARFNNIKDALVRIEEGTFGVCQICGKKIEEGRLEANPAAKTCVEHKESIS